LTEQPSVLDACSSNWQTVIWREWCRAKDEDYAYYLFDLVKETALGWKFVASIAAVGAVFGASLGYLLGSILTADLFVRVGLWDLTALPAPLLAWAMGVAGSIIGVVASREYRVWYFWWQGQPAASRVEWALHRALSLRPDAAQVWAQPLHRLELNKKQDHDLPQLMAELESRDWIDRFVARQLLVALGGESANGLRDLATDRSSDLAPVAMWLLTGIEQETTNSCARRVRDTLCPRCLARFAAHTVGLSLGVSFTYYGCRICHQSRQFYTIPRGIVAVLDRSWGHHIFYDDGLLKVNWLTRRTVFDFDRVELIRATDEDVERFAVQVGNDTDSVRLARYGRLTCSLGPACRLSENTLRILRRMFGCVEQTGRLLGQDQVTGVPLPPYRPVRPNDFGIKPMPMTRPTRGAAAKAKFRSGVEASTEKSEPKTGENASSPA
jgi:hypothetical protein